MKTANLDGRKIFTKEQLHEALARSLKFPEYYGGNLDALFDMLTASSDPISIEITHADELADHLGDYFDKFTKVVVDASEDNAGLEMICIMGPAYSHTLQHFLSRRAR